MERDKRQKRRSFSAEYKAEAVRLVKNSGKSIGVVALELGLVESALRRWVYQDEVDRGGGGDGALTSSEREELTRLRREPALAYGARNPKKLSDAARRHHLLDEKLRRRLLLAPAWEQWPSAFW